MGHHVSLATVYNTLHQFKRAGLLRELAINGAKAYFDTNTSNHNHFFIEADGELRDIPGHAIRVDGVPEPPEGMSITPHRRGGPAGAEEGLTARDRGLTMRGLVDDLALVDAPELLLLDIAAGTYRC